MISKRVDTLSRCGDWKRSGSTTVRCSSSARRIRTARVVVHVHARRSRRGRDSIRSATARITSTTRPATSCASRSTKVEQAYQRTTGDYKQANVTYVTTNTYSDVNRLTETKSPTSTVRLYHDTSGAVRGAVSSAEGATVYRYDGFGRRTHVTRGERTVKTSYTPGGRIDEVVTTEGGTTVAQEKFTYDAMGRTTRRKDVLADAETVYLYDGLGRVTRVIDPNSTSFDTTYNDGSLPVKVTVDLPPALPPQLGTRANGRTIPAVTGVQVEQFSYDGLGRVVKASNDKGSEVRFRYDGLDRVTEETQTFLGLTQTVKHQFAADGSWNDVTYPALAGGGRVRHVRDALGRVIEVTIDREPVASYRYSGTDRIVQERLGNATQRRFSYDERRRLVRQELAGPGSKGGEALWSQTVTYDHGLPKSIEEVLQPQLDVPARVLTTALVHDTSGRTVSSSTTRSSLVPGKKAEVEVSAIHSEFEAGRLKRMAEYTRDDTGTIRLARTDTFGHAADGRIDTLASKGRLGVKSDTAPADLEAVVKQVETSDAIATSQKYSYDFKGNLLYDGRFVYSYDYRDRLVRVEDTWSPFRYIERVDFHYDALGRRVQVSPSRDTAPRSLLTWGGGWQKSPQWFIYDGAQVIGEVLRDPKAAGAPATAGQRIALARYVFGAREGQRLRMDRRADDELGGRLVTHYLHDDLQGGLRILSNDSAQPVFVGNREPPPGTSAAAPERPPGDELFIENASIRVPYVSGASRVDGFAGTLYNEQAHKSGYNYRSAYEFSFKLDQVVLRQSIATRQNQLLVIFGAMAAAPVVLPMAVEGAAASLASPTAMGVIEPILLTVKDVALNFGTARYTHSEYSSSDLLRDLGSGALNGVSGGITRGLGIGRLGNYAVEALGQTAWEVGVHGRGWGDAFMERAVTVATSEVQGAVISVVKAGVLRGLSRLRSARIQGSGQSIRTSSAKADLPESSVRSLGGSSPASGRTGQMRLRRLLDAPRDEAEEAFDAGVMQELMNGTDYSREIARRLKAGLLFVQFRDFGDSRGFGEIFPGVRSVLLINTRHISTNARGAYRTRQVASTIVHEGIHALGLGEVQAHVGQAQFLINRTSAIAKAKAQGRLVEGDRVPFLDSDHVDLVNSYLQIPKRGAGVFMAEIDRRDYNFKRAGGGHGLSVVRRIGSESFAPISVDPFALETPLPSTGSRFLDTMIAPTPP